MGFILTICCVLFLRSLVAAQCSGPTTITTSSDADAISSCSTFKGDIIIDSAASGDIYLNGIDTVTGSLTAINATSLTSLNANKLSTIGGDLYLWNLPKLTAVSFTSLEQVRTLSCIGLPELKGLPFDTGLTETQYIWVSDTGLTSFAGITLTTVEAINFSNNARLETVDLDALVNSTLSLSFQANSPSLTIQLASLEAVYGNLTFQNVSGIDITDLQNVTGSFTCYSCSMANYTAKWVQHVAGNLAFVSCDLQSLEFPSLAAVGGGFQVSNNSQLTELSTFPWLASVEGPMILHGVFESTDFPSLDFVQGYIDVETTSSNSTICDDINKIYSDHDLKGGLNCQVSVSQAAAASIVNIGSSVNLTNFTNTTTSDDGGDDDGNSSGLGAGVIAGIVVGAVVVLVGVGLAIFFYRRFHKKKSLPPSTTDAVGLMPGNELHGIPKQGRAEMYVDPRNVAEMTSYKNFAVELDDEKANMRRMRVKEIPGIHEAGNRMSAVPVIQQPTRATEKIFSPVSPMSGVDNDRSAASTITTVAADEYKKTTKSFS